jgi:hypothetical protein
MKYMGSEHVFMKFGIMQYVFQPSLILRLEKIMCIMRICATCTDWDSYPIYKCELVNLKSANIED